MVVIMYAAKLGKVMRRIRERRGENLATLSKKYGESIAYLSAIEVGKQMVPNDYSSRINKIYLLSEEENLELTIAIEETKKTWVVNFDNVNEERKDFNKVFARKINTVNQPSLEKLRKLLEVNE